MNTLVIEELDVTATESALQELSAVLVDCVEGGASIGFVLPMTMAKADAFWRDVASAVAARTTVLLVARDSDGIVGTVQLQKATKENQPHRADVSKLLVHRRARNRGIGEQLMRRVEAVAAREGRRVLVLDTATAEAERLYVRLGWQRCGEIPDYALMPDGSFCATVVYWKHVTTQ
jgi:ribosomal protein S18 acetylase RimI-like enzyme